MLSLKKRVVVFYKIVVFKRLFKFTGKHLYRGLLLLKLLVFFCKFCIIFQSIFLDEFLQAIRLNNWFFWFRYGVDKKSSYREYINWCLFPSIIRVWRIGVFHWYSGWKRIWRRKRTTATSFCKKNYFSLLFSVFHIFYFINIFETNW